MEYILGIVLASLTASIANLFRFENRQLFYSIVLMVIAVCYAAFALYAGHRSEFITETLVGLVFFVLAVAGYCRNIWLIVIGLLAHGIYDVIHQDLLPYDGIPKWWQAFGYAYDLTVAIWLVWYVKWRNQTPAVDGGGLS